MALEVGETLDRRYVLRRLSASSDSGDVYAAEHRFLDRMVAVHVARDGDAESARALASEARLLERIRHPAVLSVIDVGETRHEQVYLVTEPLLGRPLDVALAVRRVLPLDEALQIAFSIGGALVRAHSVGVVHRGLSPASVLTLGAPAGGVSAKLLDVGVWPSPLGMLGGPLGAMAYAAPERFRGKDRAPVEDAPRYDVHALGALLLEMIAGDLPPRDERDVAHLALSMPEPLAEVCARALADPSERYATMTDMIDALTEAAALEPVRASLPPPPSAADNRRQHPRVGYVTPVRLRLANGEALDGRSQDISSGGLLVLVHGDVGPSEDVLLRFALPSSGRVVSVPARSRWVRDAAGRTALGLSFDDPGEKVLADIQTYVDNMGGGDFGPLPGLPSLP